MSGPSEQKVKGEGREQYEDDFEKDLDWLISEEERSDGQQDPEDEDVEAQIDKELEEEERWPSPLDTAPESDRDSAFDSLPLAPPPSTPPPPPAEPLPLPLAEGEESEEEKQYILEKIQQANQELKAQAAPDHSRRRRLQFKDSLVDLVVPPVEYEQDGAPQGSSEEQQEEQEEEREEEQEVAGKMSVLQISQQEEEGGEEEKEEDEEGGDWAGRQGRVLVEKDGKFDLVSLREVESRGLLPPLPCSYGDAPHSPRGRGSASSPRHGAGVPLTTGPAYAPKPPPPVRNRPNSAGRGQRGAGRGSKRRVQSAGSPSAHATFTLSPEQKHLQLKQQQRRERLCREEEERRREEEAQKRQENELAFRAWMQRKREQLQAERRVLRAQEMEKTNGQREMCDPEEAFKFWLKSKQQQQKQEKRLEELKRLEEERCYYLHSQEESEQAFRLWLKRKHAEKRLEMRVARERSRRLVMEARRARRMQDLLCSTNEAKSFCFTDHYGYRY
ncbi:coiled-coil domain-containing protein 181 isoform X1 [Anguilla rostrata]|uniref:coiled-coil domain-containing protein 181 isoform X1 n=1 Tax=Anguilla rostrata TaxID=7938 RepID=UPI0030D2AC42